MLGGSIACCLGENAFPLRVLHWLEAAFPPAADAVHSLHNAAIPGVQSKYFTSCLKWHMPADVDLLLVSPRLRRSQPLPVDGRNSTA